MFPIPLPPVPYNTNSNFNFNWHHHEKTCFMLYANTKGADQQAGLSPTWSDTTEVIWASSREKLSRGLSPE